MKPRRVVVEIELETEAKVADLRRNYKMTGWVGQDLWVEPIQVTVNVIRIPEPKKKVKRV